MADRSLHEIAEEMESLTDGDPEASHCRADDLLIEAIWWLSADESRHIEATAGRITGAFKRLAKWYA